MLGAYAHMVAFGETTSDNLWGMYRILYASGLGSGPMKYMNTVLGDDTNGTAATSVVPPVNQPCCIHVTRISNVIRIYVNGVDLGIATTITPPNSTGSTTAKLHVGESWIGTAPDPLLIADLRVINAGYSAAQILLDAQYYGLSA